jgi:hypothetical protein
MHSTGNVNTNDGVEGAIAETLGKLQRRHMGPILHCETVPSLYPIKYDVSKTPRIAEVVHYGGIG